MRISSGTLSFDTVAKDLFFKSDSTYPVDTDFTNIEIAIEKEDLVFSGILGNSGEIQLFLMSHPSVSIERLGYSSVAVYRLIDHDATTKNYSNLGTANIRLIGKAVLHLTSDKQGH